MKPRRPRSQTPQPKNTPRRATPEQLRSYVYEMYALRQAEWQLQLLEDERPDWSSLLGLHLQLSELERLQTAVEELL